MNVLVDTSVWIGHFKQRNKELVALLTAGRVVCHPYVVLEIACGTPPHRHQVIGLLRQLSATSVASADELLHFIGQRALHGRGCGLVDISLLASTLLHPRTVLWTLDKRLHALATELGVAHHPLSR